MSVSTADEQFRNSGIRNEGLDSQADSLRPAGQKRPRWAKVKVKTQVNTHLNRTATDVQITAGQKSANPHAIQSVEQMTNKLKLN